MRRGWKTRSIAILIACAATTATAQHAQDFQVGLGFGYSEFSGGSSVVPLSEDCVVILSEGYQIGDTNTGGLLAVTGLSSGTLSFQLTGFDGAVPPFQILMQRVYRLDDQTAVYLGKEEWDQGNGHFMVFRNIGAGLAGEIVIHLGLPVDIWPKGWAEPLVLNGTTAVFATPGPDSIMGTSDDLLLLCRGLGTAGFNLTAYAVGSGSSGALLRMGADYGVTALVGLDGVMGTNDDELAVIRFTSGTFSVTSHALGLPLGRWIDGSMPIQVGPGMVIYPTTTGSGGAMSGTTASYTLVRGLPNSPETVPVFSMPAGSMYAWGAPRPVPLGGGCLAHLGAGADLTPGTMDDEVVVVGSLDGTLVVSAYSAGVPLGSVVSSLPPLLVDGLLVTPSHGLDGQFGTNDDGLVAVEGLASASPQFSFIPMGNAAIRLKRIHGEGFWAVMLTEAPVYVAGLGAAIPSLNPLPEMEPMTTRAVGVNDWTQMATLPGVYNGTSLNDTLRIIQFPFVETVGDPTSGSGGLAPVLSASTYPTVGGGWFPLEMDLANPNTYTALAFSPQKAWWPVSPTTTLYVNPMQIDVIMDGQVDPLGSKTWLIQLPDDPCLCGRSWAVQGMVMDPAATDGFTVTNGLVLHL